MLLVNLGQDPQAYISRLFHIANTFAKSNLILFRTNNVFSLGITEVLSYLNPIFRSKIIHTTTCYNAFYRLHKLSVCLLNML